MQTVADPLDPSAVNYGEYRKMSYVEHQRGGRPEQGGPSPAPGPQQGPSMPPPGAAQPPPQGPELGPVMGPSKPTQVAKELTAFMPASLRVKRPTHPPSSSAGLMRPRTVAPVARPGVGKPAAGAGAAAKPKASSDKYEDFMSELSGLL